MVGRIKEGRGTLLGNAGEHYVMAELLRRDIVSGLAPRNAPGIDILAALGSRSFRIRVKTKSPEADSWVWMAKAEAHEATIFVGLAGSDPDDIVALVDIPQEGPAQILLFPTVVIDSYLKKNHEEWLARPGRDGQKHNPSKMRRLRAGEFIMSMHASHGIKWLDLSQIKTVKSA